MEIEKVCKVCGLWFVARSNRQVYCSEQCKAVGNARNASASYRRKTAAEFDKAVKEGKVCPVCGKIVTRSPRAKYCSKSCSWKAKQEKSQKKDVGMGFGKGTICWDCNWCTGKERKCPWVTRFEPVPGWVAEKKKLRIYKKALSFV